MTSGKESSSKNNNIDHDVAILGSGLSGGVLACILAKAGVKVLMIEAGVHPRFAIGESSTPDTSFKFKILAAKYDVPEIHNLASFYDLKDKVSSACGVKRGFSYVYHREGQAHKPSETHQFPTLAPPLGPDAHLFRQDTDAYITHVATQYGAKLKTNTRVQNIDFAHDRVTLETQQGEEFSAKFLVDGSGFRSVVADKFDLRKSNEECFTNSRGIFTHMSNVKLYDDVDPLVEQFDLPYPVSQGTLHHVFEGGWFWVIPFNNHPDSTNPLCSVGLLLNRDIHPETGMDAEEEFFHYVNKFGIMKKQFENAQAVRPWVSSGRIQYHSKQLVGHRYALLAHAAGFVDPLFSSGLTLTNVVIDELASKLITSVKNDDFSLEQFTPMNESFSQRLEFYDTLIGGAFVAFQDYDLWDAWFRLWSMSNFIGTLMNFSLYFQFIASKDKNTLKQAYQSPYNGVLANGFKPHKVVLDKAFELIKQVKEEKLCPKQAANEIRSLIANADYFPKYMKWGDPKVRATKPYTLIRMIRIYLWYVFKGPKEHKQYLVGFNPVTVYLYIFKSVFKNNKLANKRKWWFIRDIFKAKNSDWKLSWRPRK